MKNNDQAMARRGHRRGHRWGWWEILLVVAFVLLAVLAILLGGDIGDAPEGP